ncbi:MAG: hypothetical protein QM767_29755 [Anaeromyxobacter sp.]
MRRPLPRTALLAALAALLACARGDRDAEARLRGPSTPAATEGAFDADHPEAGLALDADAVARRLGAFEWDAAVEWTTQRKGAEADRLRVTETHTLRQFPAGEFAVRAELDPGQGPGSVGGKELVYVGGLTYGRALPAPFRVRPTDHGRDARRYREDSFGMVREVLGLLGPGARLERAGEERVLGREAVRYQLSLAEAPAPTPAPAAPGAQLEDPDTARRRAFLDGRRPTQAKGEVLLDAATGAPLRARLSATFRSGEQREVTTTVELSAQVRAVGAVKAVSAPAGALPDERKPAGPSTALEAAGLKKRGEQPAGGAEPADEQE